MTGIDGVGSGSVGIAGRLGEGMTGRFATGMLGDGIGSPGSGVGVKSCAAEAGRNSTTAATEVSSSNGARRVRPLGRLLLHLGRLSNHFLSLVPSELGANCAKSDAPSQ
jgi:hypothetical protein